MSHVFDRLAGKPWTDPEERVGVARAALGVVANLHFRPTTCQTVSDTLLVDGPHEQLHSPSPPFDRRHRRALSALPAVGSYGKDNLSRLRNSRQKRLRRLSKAAVKLSDSKSMKSPVVQSWSNAISVFVPTDEESSSSRDSDWSDDDSYHSVEVGGKTCSSEATGKGEGPSSSEADPTPAKARDAAKETEDNKPTNGGSDKAPEPERSCSVDHANVQTVTARSREQTRKTALAQAARNPTLSHSDRQCTLPEPIHNTGRQLLNERGSTAQTSSRSRERKSKLIPNKHDGCDTLGVNEVSQVEPDEGPKPSVSSDTDAAVPCSPPEGSPDSPQCPLPGVDNEEDPSQSKSAEMPPALLQQCPEESKGLSTSEVDQKQHLSPLTESGPETPKLSEHSESKNDKKEAWSENVSQSEPADAFGACVSSDVDTRFQASGTDEQCDGSYDVDVDQERDNVYVSSIKDEATSRSNTNSQTQQCHPDGPYFGRAPNISDHSHEYHFQDWPTSPERTGQFFKREKPPLQCMQSEDACCQRAGSESAVNRENEYTCQQTSQKVIESVDNADSTGSDSNRARTNDNHVNAAHSEPEFYAHDPWCEEDNMDSTEAGQMNHQVSDQQFVFASNLLSTCLRERATLQGPHITHGVQRTQPVGRLKRRILLSARRQAASAEEVQLDEIPGDLQLGSPQLQQAEPEPALAEHKVPASQGAGSFPGGTAGPLQTPAETAAMHRGNGPVLSDQYKMGAFPLASGRDRQRRFTFGMERLPPTFSRGFQYSSFHESRHQRRFSYGMGTVPPHFRNQALAESNVRQRRLTCGFEKLPSGYPPRFLNDCLPKSNQQRRLSICGMERASPYSVPQFKMETMPEQNARQRRLSYGMERLPPAILQRYQSENGGNMNRPRGPSSVVERQLQRDYNPRQRNRTFSEYTPPRRMSYGFESLSPHLTQHHRTNAMPELRALQQRNSHQAEVSHDVAWTSGEFSRPFCEQAVQDNGARVSYTQQSQEPLSEEQSAHEECEWNEDEIGDGRGVYRENWDDECTDNVDRERHQDIACGQHFPYEDSRSQGEAWGDEEGPTDEESAHQWELWADEQDRFARQKMMPPDYEHYSNAQPYAWKQEYHLKFRKGRREYAEQWNDQHFLQEGERACTTAWKNRHPDSECAAVSDEQAYASLAYENKWNHEGLPGEIASKLQGQESPTGMIAPNSLPSPVEARITHLSSGASGNSRPSDVCHQSVTRPAGSAHNARMREPFYFNEGQAPQPLGQTQVTRASNYAKFYQDAVHECRPMPPLAKPNLSSNYEPDFSQGCRCGPEALSRNFALKPSVDSAVRKAQSAAPETVATVNSRRKSCHSEADGMQAFKRFEGLREQNEDWSEHGKLDENLTKSPNPVLSTEARELRSQRETHRSRGRVKTHSLESELGVMETKKQQRRRPRQHSESDVAGQHWHGESELTVHAQHDEAELEDRNQYENRKREKRQLFEGELERQKQYGEGQLERQKQNEGELERQKQYGEGELERQKQYEGQLERQRQYGDGELERQRQYGEGQLERQKQYEGQLERQRQYGDGELEKQRQYGEGEPERQKQFAEGELERQKQHGEVELEKLKQYGEGELVRQKQYGEGELERQKQYGDGELERQMQYGDGKPEIPKQYGGGELEKLKQYGEGELERQKQHGDGELERQKQHGDGELERQKQHGDGELERQKQHGDGKPEVPKQYGGGELESQKQYAEGELENRNHYGEGELESGKQHGKGELESGKEHEEIELQSKEQNGKSELGIQNHHRKGEQESQRQRGKDEREEEKHYDEGELESPKHHDEGELESQQQCGEGELEKQNRYGEGEPGRQKKREKKELENQNPYEEDKLDSQTLRGEGGLESQKPYCEGKVAMISLVDRNGVPLDPRMVGVAPSSDRKHRHSAAGVRAIRTSPMVGSNRGRKTDNIEVLQQKLQMMTLCGSSRNQDLHQVGHQSSPDGEDAGREASNKAMNGPAELRDDKNLSRASAEPGGASSFVSGPSVAGMATAPSPVSDPRNISMENTNSSNTSSVFYSYRTIASSRFPARSETSNLTLRFSAGLGHHPCGAAPVLVTQWPDPSSHGQPPCFREDPDFPIIDWHLNGNQSSHPEIARCCFHVTAGRGAETETLTAHEVPEIGHYLNSSPENGAAPSVESVIDAPGDVKSVDLLAEVNRSLPRKACFEPEGDIILK